MYPYQKTLFEILIDLDLEGVISHVRNSTNYSNVSRIGIDSDKTYTDNLRRAIVYSIGNKKGNRYPLFKTEIIDQELVKMINEAFYIKLQNIPLAQVSFANINYEQKFGKQDPKKDTFPSSLNDNIYNILNDHTIVHSYSTNADFIRLGISDDIHDYYIKRDESYCSYLTNIYVSRANHDYIDLLRSRGYGSNIYSEICGSKCRNLWAMIGYKLLISDRSTPEMLLRKAFTEKFIGPLNRIKAHGIYSMNDKSKDFVYYLSHFILKDFRNRYQDKNTIQLLYDKTKDNILLSTYFNKEMNLLQNFLIKCENHVRNNSHNKYFDIEHPFIGNINHENMKLSVLSSPINFNIGIYQNLDYDLKNMRSSIISEVNNWICFIKENMDISTLLSNIINRTKHEYDRIISDILKSSLVCGQKDLSTLSIPLLSGNGFYINYKTHNSDYKPEIVYKNTDSVIEFEKNAVFLFVILKNEPFTTLNSIRFTILSLLANKDNPISKKYIELFELNNENIDLLFQTETVNLLLFLEFIMAYVYLYYMIKNTCSDNISIINELESIIDAKIDKFNKIISIYKNVGKYFRIGYISSLVNLDITEEENKDNDKVSELINRINALDDEYKCIIVDINNKNDIRTQLVGNVARMYITHIHGDENSKFSLQLAQRLKD